MLTDSDQAGRIPAPQVPENPVPGPETQSITGQSVRSEKPRHRLFIVLVTILILITLGVVALTTVIIPSEITGNVVKPFQNHQIVFSEKVSFSLRDPELGEAVKFTPEGRMGIEYIGIIVGISDTEGMPEYSIISSGSKPWTVARKDIVARVYYPPVSDEDAENLIPDVTPQPTTPPITPTPAVTATPQPTVKPATAATGKPTASDAFYAYIDGVAYVDENYNGTRDSYEKGLMGRDINIYKVNGSATLATRVITNDDGYYKAKVTAKARYQPQLGDMNLSYQYPTIRTVLIETKGEIKRLDFPMVPLGARNPEPGSGQGIIQGIVFSDQNRNGSQDSGESGLHFFHINLYRTSDNSKVATTTSSENGDFTFTNLELTSYRIETDNDSGQYTITKSTSYVELTGSHTLDNTARLGVVLNY